MLLSDIIIAVISTYQLLSFSDRAETSGFGFISVGQSKNLPRSLNKEDRPLLNSGRRTSR